MSDVGRVLIVIAEQQVRIYHTPGTEVACIVDGEDVELPDEWREGLTQQVTHSLPISLDVDEMFGDREPEFDGESVLVAELCLRCDTEHIPGACPPAKVEHRIRS